MERPAGGSFLSLVRKRVIDAVVLIVGLVSVLALAEMAARPFYPATPPLKSPQVRFRFSPRFGWEMVPDPEAFSFDRPAPVNERGLRGPLIPYVRTDTSAVRWLALGGGSTFGVGVDLDQDFAGRAAALESARLSRPVELIDAGCEGYDLYQSLRFLEREGRLYSPDVIIVTIDPTDLPASGFRDSLFTPARFAAEAPFLNRVVDLHPSLYGRLLRFSRLMSFLDTRVRAFFRLGHRLPDTHPTAVEERPARIIDILLGRQTPALDQAWGTMAAEFFRLAESARAVRAGVYVVALPMPAQLRRLYPRARYQSRLAALCGDNGFYFVDPLNELRRQRTHLLRLYLPRFPYLSDDAHRIVGEALAAEMATPLAARSRWQMPSQAEQ